VRWTEICVTLHSLCTHFKEFKTRNKMAEAEGSKQNNSQVKKRTRNPSGRYFCARSRTFRVSCIVKCKSYTVEHDSCIHICFYLKLSVSICQLSIRLCLCFNFRMEARKKKTTEGGWKSVCEQ
jgi:hypothetical protein